jgi:acyl-CoA oxidase
VVIPKENMLDRFVVNDKGEFESPIPSDNRRFFYARELWLVAELIPRSALAAAKSGLTIARYSDQRTIWTRRRIRSSNLKLSYSSTKTFAVIGKNVCNPFCVTIRYESFINKSESEMPEIEALAAGMKRLIQLRHRYFATFMWRQRLFI